MNKLTEKMKEEFHGRLIEDLNRLERELSQLMHRNPDLATEMIQDAGSDEGQQAEIVDTLSSNLSLEEELLKNIDDTKKALKALEIGAYGRCKYCQQEIPMERLRIRPTSTSCVACKRTLTQEL
jgi:DnaK suppressor protein